MNLIQDKWIPVKRADGTSCKIAPWEIGLDNNPVSEIRTLRPDFRGGIYQFLIGLVQTAYMPEDNKEWAEIYETPPSYEELRSAFETYKKAFELVNTNGPAFMQDFDLLEEAEETEVRGLLIDSPGENTIKKNLDHFIKRHSVAGLCDTCTAVALFTLQTNAPAGGQGNRTGLRGGGPLTTLIIGSTGTSVWKNVWLNILPKEIYFKNTPNNTIADIFPWMGNTKESINDNETHPHQVNQLQLYWGMPRRIRLRQETDRGLCSICGAEGEVRKSYRAKNYGTKYSSLWLHTLSPYRKQEEKDGSVSLIAIKGKQGGFSYPDWLNLTLANGNNNCEAATVIRSFFVEKKPFLLDSEYTVWCTGYDMDNMKARCWYDQTMPILYLPEAERELFIEKVQLLVNSANAVAKILRDKIKEAWFERPNEAKGDTSNITTSFMEETEKQFYSTLDNIRKAIMTGSDLAIVMAEWRTTVIQSAERLFDRFAVQDSDEIKNMKRIAEAAKGLRNILHSPKTKSIQILKEEA